MDWISYAIDTQDSIYGDGWVRPPVNREDIINTINQYRTEIVDLERQLRATTIQEIRDNLEARIHTLTYEANRLEDALKSGKEIPGALIDIQLNGREAYFVPDLHGNVRGFLSILNWNDPQDSTAITLFEKIKNNRAILIIGGDALHPISDPLDEMRPSLALMEIISELRAEYPNQVVYLSGNHDSIYGAGEELFTKGGVFQGVEFRNHLIAERRLAYARSAQAFIDRSPLVARVMNGDEVVAIVGHTPVAKNGLTPADIIGANFDPDLKKQLTWGRPDVSGSFTYNPNDVELMRKKLGSERTVIISGHTPNDEPFWRPDNMPGHVIGQATEDFNDNLGIVRINNNSVEVVHVKGTSKLAGINLRNQLILDLTKFAGPLAETSDGDYVSFVPKDLTHILSEVDEKPATEGLIDLTAHVIAEDTPLAAPEIFIPKYGMAQFLNGVGINLGLGFLGFAAVHGYEHYIGRPANGWERFAGYTIPALAGIGGQYGLAVKVAQQTGLSLSSAMGPAAMSTIKTLPSGLLSGLPIGVAVVGAESILGVDPASIEGEIGTIFTTGALAELAMAAEVGGTSATGAMAAGATGAAIGTATLAGLAVSASALGGVLLGVGIDHGIGRLINLVDKNNDGTLSGAIARDPWLAAPIITWAACANPFIGGGIYLAHKIYQWSTNREKFEGDKAAVNGAVETITGATASAGRKISETAGKAVKFVSDAADSLGDIGREALEGAKLMAKDLLD